MITENDKAEFIGQIIDGLEDYLEQHKGVTPDMLPNDDRDEDNAAIIYGMDYGIIGDSIENELDIYDLVNSETTCNNPMVIFTVTEHIYDGFLEVIDKIQGLTLNDDDVRRLKFGITDTFRKWEVFA